MVIPDILSKKESTKDKLRFEKKNGKDPKTAMLTQDKVVSRKDLKDQISLIISILLKKNSEVHSETLNEKTSENIEPITKAAS